MFIRLLWESPELYLTWLVLVVFSICVHEACHAYVAYTQGDSTAVDNGFLTLNPLKVMGQWSLLVAAFLGFAWGAVPVNPSRFRSKASHALVAASCPLSNLLLGVVFAAGLVAAARILPADNPVARQGPGSIFLSFFSVGLRVNVFLALLNLLPVPILDGWEIFCLFIPALDRVPRRQAQQYGMIALLAILLTGLHYRLWDLADFAVGFVLRTFA
jgi:Zn-dependent protease